MGKETPRTKDGLEQPAEAESLQPERANNARRTIAIVN